MRSTLVCVIVLGVLAVGSAVFAAGVPESNVAGKKLIRVDQSLSFYTDASELATRLDSWQQTGYDGLCLSLYKQPSKNADGTYNTKNNLCFAWWNVQEITPQDVQPAVSALKATRNWGIFKHNFLWTASHAEGTKPPDWFSDADWKTVLANTRLSAKIAKEVGFEGILFDSEGYGGGAYGVWRQPWDYVLYSTSDYVIDKEAKPRPFDEVAAKVRQRGKQWAQALCSEYPDITIFVIPGLYEVAWERAVHYGKGLDATDSGLWAPFVDGVLMGLSKRAKLVSGMEIYLDSQYVDMVLWRDKCLEQSLVVSTVPELARQRITVSIGIWTDAGYGAHGRFSPDDVTVNQRDPVRHMHAVHNALAASDEYAWQWGEWGKAGEYNFLTDKPTPLMREYWKANVDGHKPQDLLWEPMPVSDIADYTKADADAAAKEPAFWSDLAAQGYTTAVSLPEFWKFRFDPEMKVRYKNWNSSKCDDSSWFVISDLKCWQSQGTRANGPGVYRLRFEVPASVDPKAQEVILAFSGIGSGTNHIYMNNAWVAYLTSVVNVSEYVKPGETNFVTLVCLNKQGPGGLMGSVKLLTRAKK